MRPALKSALFFGATWILVKLLFYYLNIFQDDIFLPGLINNFFLLTAIAVGLYLEKRREGFGEGSALSDIKNAMVAGAPYALIVSVFLFFYYRDINPDFAQDRLNERMDLLYISMERESFVDSLKMQNQDLNVLNNDEIYQHIREETAGAYSPKTLLTLSLLGLTILGFTYAIFLTVVFRKVLLRDYYKGEN
ncbi:MAG: DUF4199 family protein [Crocinitomicaceae bacterium]|nr:DUF4199 family protein [Crocinitomicaceae bacterium]